MRSDYRHDNQKDGNRCKVDKQQKAKASRCYDVGRYRIALHGSILGIDEGRTDIADLTDDQKKQPQPHSKMHPLSCPLVVPEDRAINDEDHGDHKDRDEHDVLHKNLLLSYPSFKLSDLRLKSVPFWCLLVCWQPKDGLPDQIGVNLTDRFARRRTKHPLRFHTTSISSICQVSYNSMFLSPSLPQWTTWTFREVTP